MYIGGIHFLLYRLTIMFIVSLGSVATVVSLTDGTLLVLLATTTGFLLSQDIFTCFKSPIYLLSLISDVKLLQSARYQLSTKTFVSLYGWDNRKMANLKTIAIHYLVSMIKGSALLGTSLVTVYFTFESSSDAEEVGTNVTAGFVIGLFCLLQGSHVFQRIYLFGTLRNPLFPNQSENVSNFNKSRNLLHYISIPGRLIYKYCESHTSNHEH